MISSCTPCEFPERTTCSPHTVCAMFHCVSRLLWKFQEEEVPSSEQIDKVTCFLRSKCGLGVHDVPKLAADFPQVFGCKVEAQLQQAVDVLEKDWKITGKSLTGTLKRKPRALGCNVDCGGDCIGQCDRCWVRF
jgi:hypothetical protein